MAACTDAGVEPGRSKCSGVVISFNGMHDLDRRLPSNVSAKRRPEPWVEDLFKRYRLACTGLHIMLFPRFC